MALPRYKSRKRRSIFFFLLLTLCGGLCIAGIFGTPIKNLLSGSNASAALPIAGWEDNVLTLNIRAKNLTWELRDNVLELKLYQAKTKGGLPVDTDVLIDKVNFQKHSWGMQINIGVEELPPVFILRSTEYGYQLRWLEEGLSGKRIAIDPGHGGNDPGAIGGYLGLLEKDINLKIALELRKLLEDAGAEVFMTRTTDARVDSSSHSADLLKRRDIVRDYSPDLFISIHNNSWRDGYAKGSETYYNSDSLNSQQSKIAAGIVQDSLVQALGGMDRGIKTCNDAVLQIDDPGILVEILFISNKEEEALLSAPEFPAKAGEALFSGINAYFRLPGGE